MKSEKYRELRILSENNLNFRMFSLLLLPLLLLSFGCSKTGGELRAGFEARRYRTVVAFGDSIVEGYKQPEGWPEILGRDLAGRYGGLSVINAGISGNTAEDGLRRLRQDVLVHQPDLVLISFGLNDMKNGVSLSRFNEDLAGIVGEVTASGAQPVLLQFIDVNEQFRGFNTPEYLIDAAHPNMEGYRRIAEIIRKGLIGE